MPARAESPQLVPMSNAERRDHIGKSDGYPVSSPLSFLEFDIPLAHVRVNVKPPLAS